MDGVVSAMPPVEVTLLPSKPRTADPEAHGVACLFAFLYGFHVLLHHRSYNCSCISVHLYIYI